MVAKDEDSSARSVPPDNNVHDLGNMGFFLVGGTANCVPWPLPTLGTWSRSDLNFHRCSIVSQGAPDRSRSTRHILSIHVQGPSSTNIFLGRLAFVDVKASNEHFSMSFALAEASAEAVALGPQPSVL